MLLMYIVQYSTDQRQGILRLRFDRGVDGIHFLQFLYIPYVCVERQCNCFGPLQWLALVIAATLQCCYSDSNDACVCISLTRW